MILSTHGIIGSSGGSVSSLLLDTYTGSSAAYSLKKIRTAYSGNAVRVRRSSDNTEQNFGFVSSALDTASILSFVGAGNGFITTWYDQSGNSYNQTQTNATQQPKIVESGSIILSNGVPALSFDGTDDYLVNMALGSFFAGTNVPCSIIGLYDFSLTQSSTPISMAKIATSTGLEQLVFNGVDIVNYYSYKRDNSGTIKSHTFIPIAFGQQLHTATSAGSTLTTRRNAVVKLNNVDVNVGNITLDNVSLGALSRNTISSFFNGKMQEVIIFKSDQASVITGIENTIKTNYSMTW